MTMLRPHHHHPQALSSTTTTTTTPSMRAAVHHHHGRGLTCARQQQQRRSSVAAAAAPRDDNNNTNNNSGALLAAAAAASARAALALAASALLLASPAPPALAAAAAADAPPSLTTTAPSTTTTVYFGNGCFWGRQKDFVETELRALSRPPERVSAVAGYAAGAAGAGADGKVCYHFNDPRQVYERLGHAEVVAVELDGAVAGAAADDDAAAAAAATTKDEMRAFSKTYFSQFRRLRDGRLQRLDPQDAGPGYRNVVGLPGGVRSPLFEVLKSEAPKGVQLREGKGGADEGDELSVIWIVDSSELPFYRAEQYHQYHRGMEGSFPPSYLKGQRDVALRAGRIDPTGCLEFPF